VDGGAESAAGVGRVGTEPPAVRQDQLGHACADRDRAHLHERRNGTGPGDLVPLVADRDDPVTLDPERPDRGGGEPLTAQGLHRIPPQLLNPHASPEPLPPRLWRRIRS
jgi:hypothetical protein